MLDPGKAFSSFAVDDPAAAEEFYSRTLGIPVAKVAGMEEYGLLALETGGGTGAMVYPEPDFTPATYTVMHFPVDDIEKAVDQLAARGVEFLRYGSFEQDAKGITTGSPRNAWFTDPAGNVLGLVQD
ncbi:VOC family protein [Streptomonospora litoralis]|uniref:Glyoxalase-like domain protein n=1 Tax=Streptomonospora litoralis TaxID=2498135 RepID=A0A4P6Q4D9_9ACTN|nr:VOC family protein [Streptomonospora litoralis]QBI55566.1 Glyoxalase-like domain protein [Streptomonospora litoralis]